MRGHPDVELGAPDEDFATDLVGRERTRRVVQEVSELPDTESAIARKGPQGKERVQSRADHHAFGQNAPDPGQGVIGAGAGVHFRRQLTPPNPFAEPWPLVCVLRGF